ncbi:MAG: methyltransferase family protein [Planctomycetota bacterium]
MRPGAWIALGYGLLCHAAFAAAITSMIVGLHEGLRTGIGPFEGAVGVAVNAALLIQFPLLHSALLTGGGQRILTRLAPQPLGATLATTTYATIASLQILAVFVLWSPIDAFPWRPGSPLAWAGSELAYAASWLFLIRALSEAGIGVQTGALGWTSVLRGQRPRFPDLPTRGLHARTRHPIYLGFALTLWTAPTWTLDRFALASGFTLYCVLGPLHKDRRLARRHGPAFEAQARTVPYFLPRILP